MEGDGVSHLKVAENLLKSGDIRLRSSQFKDAMQSYNRALEIRVEQLGDKHPDTAESYKAVGNVFYKEANFESAEEMYRKALEIDLEAQSDNHRVLSDRYRYMVIVLTAQRKFDEAVKMNKQSLARKLHIHGGEDHSDIAREYIGIGVLLVFQNRLEDALQMYDRVIEMCNRLGPGGDNRKVLAAALCNQALIRDKQGDLESATELLEQSLAIREEVFGEMHPETAIAYQIIARIYGQQDRLDDAIHASTKALQIRRKELGEDHPYTAKCFARLLNLKLDKAAAFNKKGLALMKAGGDYAGAVKLFREALEIYIEMGCGVDPDAASVHENLAAVYISTDKLEEAVDASAEALKIYRRKLGENHDVTKKRMEEHRSLLKRLLENEARHSS
eukprot:CAMPEP_0113614814 /NCGR_PEP_ID=MMETSP0017_2-20120614/7369_1 /TAXON_ID=2856 /ORGANISM="Cylindrotheca closterium" /LENGTH=388 /DNA_ID=CAMNT_0000524011 /DNA_START=88 /DNA_END=1252 /DNA_ORIENTATION=- /assembly_acc=CAM_ASM_000147